MIFEEVFRPVHDLPVSRSREVTVVAALNMLALSGEPRVEVIDLLGLSPKTWAEKCRGRGWVWRQQAERNGDSVSPSVVRYYIEVRQ